MVNVRSGLKLHLVKNASIKIFIRFDESLNKKKEYKLLLIKT